MSDASTEQDAYVRQELIFHLTGGHAHMSLAEAVVDFPMERINEPFTNGTYSAWALLEHIRLTQWDILEFMRNKDYVYLSWPADYWPSPDKQATADDWATTLAAYEADMQTMVEIVTDPATDLYTKIPWGEGQTIMREIMVTTDHNAYHIGELAIMRQAMQSWGPDHT